MPMTLAQIQERAYATAKAKGWHDNPLRGYKSLEPVELKQDIVHHDRVLRAQALIHTELTEMHDAIEDSEYALYIEDGKPEGLPAEAADVVIRICDVAQALGLTLDDDRSGKHWLERANGARPAAEIRRSHDMADVHAVLWLGKVRLFVDRASEAVRIDAWAEYAENLNLAVLYTASIVAGFGQDLNAALEAKMAYNETRSHRHGGKQA